jgi:transcriptional regulator with PAS, ATPase and Fis domain
MPPVAAPPRASTVAQDAATVAISPAERTQFGNLVRSPLRAALLRHLHACSDQTFDIDALVQIFARMRVDIENCIEGLAAQGVVARIAGSRPRYTALIPEEPSPRRLLEEFLATPAARNPEDSSPALRRLRELIGVDETMLLVLESIRTVAKADISTLILGPTGAGKEVVARVIHELGRRGNRTFQAVSCAALPDSLFESEMFGYEKGAFTGAHERKPGRMELADRGTLFLDEIGDLSLVSQAKLLRVLEDRKVERLGGRVGIDVDFRLVSATNRPLDAFVADNRFREDLYYRVNAFTVRLPSLRERPADIPVLAARFLANYCLAQGQPADAKTFSQGALDRMCGYPWPGNIREMVATISRTALSSRDRLVRPDDIQFLHPESETGAGLGSAFKGIPLHQVERDHIRKTLEAVSWNRRAAARVLEVSRERLHRKIRAYNLTPPAGHTDEPSEPGALR